MMLVLALHLKYWVTLVLDFKWHLPVKFFLAMLTASASYCEPGFGKHYINFRYIIFCRNAMVETIHYSWYTQVFIDGPYGTPSGDIFQAEHAVLIGAGIGVTPFASILQSIVLRYRNARQVCPRCNHGWTGYIPTSVMRLKKVYISQDYPVISFLLVCILLSSLCLYP